MIKRTSLIVINNLQGTNLLMHLKLHMQRNKPNQTKYIITRQYNEPKYMTEFLNLRRKERRNKNKT